MVKKAWIEEEVVQCGYSQSGQMMQAAGIIANTPQPDAEKVIEKMDQVLCRCGTYPRIRRGINTAIRLTKKEGGES